MSNSNYLLRWTVAGRWIATLGMGIIVALGYVIFRPAHAQERGTRLPDNAAAVPAADKNSTAPPPKADGGLLSKEEIAAKVASETGSSEPEKKETTPAKEADTASILRDIKWLSPHMWAFYAIWVVSLIGVSYAVERFIGLRRSKILPTDLAAGLRALASRAHGTPGRGDFDLRHAQRLCNQYPSAAAAVVRAMLAKVGRLLPEVEQAMTEACEHEATRLFANVRVQNLTFNVAPMLGLAGTVHGMILCFYTTAHLPMEVKKMDVLATGIYAALICTLAGLIVAIPAGILSHYFEGRILKMFTSIEELARSLVPHFERYEGRPRQLTAGDGAPGGNPPVGAGRPLAARLLQDPGLNQPPIIEMPREEDEFEDEDDPLPAPKGEEDLIMAVKIKKGSEMMQIPVVPLVDTVFNLLIFFLVATKVAEAEKELPIQAPYAGEAQAITVRPAEMIINIDQKGRCFIGDRPASLHELNLALHNAWLTNRGRTPVTLRADERCPWKFVVQVIDCCKRNKVRDYHVTTRNPAAEGKT